MAHGQLAERATSRRATSRPAKKSAAKREASSSSVINLRADASTRALIDKAARSLGQNRTEFMLASARALAQEVLLNQVYFQLGEKDWKALNEALEAPTPPNAALRRLMSKKLAWTI